MKCQDRELHSQAVWCSGFWGLKCLPSLLMHKSTPWPSSKSGSHPAHPLVSPLLMSRKHSDQLNLLPHHSFSKNTTGAVSYKHPVFLFLSVLPWSIVDLQCFKYSHGSVTHTYMSILSTVSSVMGYHKMWDYCSLCYAVVLLVYVFYM